MLVHRQCGAGPVKEGELPPALNLSADGRGKGGEKGRLHQFGQPPGAARSEPLLQGDQEGAPARKAGVKWRSSTTRKAT
jgi:hypothetical protein